jgi:acyl carrier protein
VLSRVIDTVFDAVNIRAVSRGSVDGAVVLGRNGLGLDSVDILEVVVAIEHEFKVKVANKETGQAVFQTIGTIAQFVAANSPLFRAPAPQP